MNERLFEVSSPAPGMSGAQAHPEVAYEIDWTPEALPSNGEPLAIVFNTERVDEVLSRLMAAYEGDEFPYNLDAVRLPQDPRHMPNNLEYGSRDHAMFLWNACYYMRGGIKSVEAIKRLAKIYESAPELFDCSVAAELDPAVVAAYLKEFGLGFQDTVSKQWVANSRKLQQRCDGDPRMLFDGVETYDDALARIKNDGRGGGFSGFQEKMTSMIIYYLMDEDMIKQFPFPIPVDLHVMRVSIANKLIEFPNAPSGTNLYTPETLAALRKLYFDYAVEHKINPLRLCDAVWLLSESQCGKHPGNVTLEPQGRANRSGRSTILIPQTVDTASPVQQAAYESSCRQCPIEQTCDYVLPGKPYYIQGVLYVRGERTRFPEPDQGRLF